MTYNRYIYSLLSALLMTVAVMPFLACSDDGDDIEEIFGNKTWYIVGGVMNGNNIEGEDLRQFYSNPYYLKFTNNSVSGALEQGSEFAGYWTANGENKTISFDIRNYREGNVTPLSKKIRNIIEKTTHYSGDANILYFYTDNGSNIMLNTRRE